MVWGAVIGAGAALAGGAMQQSAASGASTDQRHFTREMWNKQMEAANTAHQRQVKDLRAAGLNPILSAKQTGAAIPNAGNYQTPQYRNIGADAVQAATAATSAQSQRMIADENTKLSQWNQKKVEQELQNLDTQNQYTKENIRHMAQLIINAQLQSEQITASTQQTVNSSKLLEQQATGQKHRNVGEQIMAEFFDKQNAAKIIKDLGPIRGSLFQIGDFIERAAKRVFEKDREIGEKGDLFHIKIRNRAEK